MARLLQRKAELRIGDLIVRGIDMKFSIEMRIDPDPNTLDLTVWNLSEGTRVAMEREWQTIVLVAGYEETAQIVFSGEARKVEHTRLDKDLSTRVLCGDGVKAFEVARSDVSFKANTEIAAIVERLAKDLGVKSEDALARLARRDWPGASERFLQGYTASGPTVRELDRVLRAAGLEWSIQNGNLQILAPDEAVSAQAVVLSPESGLIGTPGYGTAEPGEAKVVKVRSLLQPAIRPGRLVRVKSKNVNGAFRVVRVVHTGETEGNDWYSDVEAVEAAA